MPDLPDHVDQAADGLQVTPEARNRTGHILRRHSAITEPDIAQALTAPERICPRKTELMQRVYQGTSRLAGLFQGSFPMAVVEPMVWTARKSGNGLSYHSILSILARSPEALPSPRWHTCAEPCSRNCRGTLRQIPAGASAINSPPVCPLL